MVTGIEPGNFPVNSDDDFRGGLRRVASRFDFAILKPLWGSELTAGQGDSPVKKLFHDITTHSRGLFTDTYRGGLRQDLTVYLKGANGTISMGGNALIQDAMPIFSDSRIDPSDPVDAYLHDGDFPGFRDHNSGMNLPKFGLLRSWYKQTGSSYSISRFENENVPINHGLFPVLVRAEIDPWIKIQTDFSNFAKDPPTGLTLNNFMKIRTGFYVSLWNPYNVVLDATNDLYVTIKISPDVKVSVTDLYIRKDGGSYYRPSNFSDHSSETTEIEFDFGGAVQSGGTVGISKPNEIVLKIPVDSTRLQPGECRIYSLASDTKTYSPPLELAPGAANTQAFSFECNSHGTNNNAAWELSSSDPDPTFSDSDDIPDTSLTQNDFFCVTGKYSGTREFWEVRLYQGKPSGSGLLQLVKGDKKGFFADIGSLKGISLKYQGSENSRPNRAQFAWGSPFNAQVVLSGVSNWYMRPVTDHFDQNPSIATSPKGGALRLLTAFNLRNSRQYCMMQAGADDAYKIYNLWAPFAPGDTNDAGYRDPGPTDILTGHAYTLYAATRYPDSTSNPDLPIGLTPREVGAFTVYDYNKLGHCYPIFDVRGSVELVSLGRLQHVNLGINPQSPSHAFANSWIPPQLEGSRYSGYAWVGPADSQNPYYAYPYSNPAKDPNNLVYDTSFFLNDATWDRFFLSTIDPSVSNFTSQLGNVAPLPNSRLRFTTTGGRSYDDFLSGGADEEVDRFRTGAACLVNEGAFNINSTSVEAWKALLGAFTGLTVNGKAPGNRAPIARTYSPVDTGDPFFDDGSDSSLPREAGLYSEGYSRIRALTKIEIEALAEHIVQEVKLRGPFTSLSDFINRRPMAATEDVDASGDPGSANTRFRGAIQAAIDKVSRQSGMINNHFYGANTGYTGDLTDSSLDWRTFFVRDNLYTSSIKKIYHHDSLMMGEFKYPKAVGVPGFLTQADVLSSIGLAITTRSDTFRIRAYGEALNPTSSRVEARAWCEAIVQRVAEPMERFRSGDSLYDPADSDNLIKASGSFGRRFRIVSFRWLHPKEI